MLRILILISFLIGNTLFAAELKPNCFQLLKGTGHTLNFKNKPLKIFFKTNRVIWKNAKLKLTDKEFEILLVLLNHDGPVLIKELQDALWGDSATGRPIGAQVALRQLNDKFTAIDNSFNRIRRGRGSVYWDDESTNDNINVIEPGVFEFDSELPRLIWKGNQIVLKPQEVKVFKSVLASPNFAIDIFEIGNQVWGKNISNQSRREIANAIYVVLSNLRFKISAIDSSFAGLKVEDNMVTLF